MKKFYLILIVFFTLKVVNAQWQQCNGPYGGFITCFASNSTYLYAGTNDGIYKSYNGGLSWVEVSNGLTQKSITSLAICGTKIFAGTIDNGIFISTNSGVSWTSINNGLLSKRVVSLVVKDSTVFAGIWWGGIYKLTNNSSTWTYINSNLPNNNISSLAVSGSNLYTTIDANNIDSLVYYSNNNGLSWNLLNVSLPGFPNYITANGSKVIAYEFIDMFISNDYGTSWSKANFMPSQYYDISSVIIKDSNIFVGTENNGVFVSTDNGFTWTAINNGLPLFKVSVLYTNGTDIFAGTWGSGVFKSSNNGSSWIPLNTGMINTDLSSIAISGSNVYAGSMSGNGISRSTDNGLNWTTANNGLTDKHIIDLIAYDSNVFTINYNKINRSTNNALNWTRCNNGIDTNFYINCLANIGSKLLAANHSTTGGIYTSTNNGTNWILSTNNGIPNSVLNNISSFAVSGSYIYALTSMGDPIMSTDGGSFWILINEWGYPRGEVLGVSGNNILISAMPDIIFPDSPIIGTLYISTDYGDSWQENPFGFPFQSYINSFTSNKSFLFASTNQGVILSTDNGFNWINVNDNLTDININKVVVNDNYLFAAIYNKGIWRRPLTDFVGIKENSITNKISIYPNPTSTNLTIETNSNIKQSFEITNLLGQSLYTSYIYKKAIVDVSHFPKGIYIIKINTDKDAIVKKFVKE